jgi:hypothetical protein
MAERTRDYPVHVEGRSAEPAASATCWESGPSRSQGTDSVRGTWCSEGEAGCHFSCQGLWEWDTEPGPAVIARTARISGTTRRASGAPAVCLGFRGCGALRTETGDAGCLAGRCQPDRMEACGPEEPDEGNLHVRICGEAGGASPRLYPDRAKLNS